MAMIECPECRKLVSSKASMCPNCGFGIEEWFGMNFETCPKCNTIIKKDETRFCPKCNKSFFQLQTEIIQQKMLEMASKEREEDLRTGRLKEFPWKDRTVLIYTKVLEDYKLYNRIDTFIDKIMKLQKWLKNETNIDIEAFKKRYQDKNNGPKTIYDCCDILTNFLSNTCTKRCQDIANKINEAIPNKNFIRITDVMDYYLNYQDKLQIKTCLGELASLDNQVKQKLEMDKIYRDIKKAGRGKFIGVGSGVKGALKGILTAGVANAAYGGLYELKNSIGNTMDTAFANTEVTENLHKADFKNLLYSVLINDLNYFIPVVADLAVDILNQYFNIKIEDVDYLYEKYRNIEKKVQARLNKNDIETFQECLQEYPFYPPIYKCILEEFGDKDNEIEDIGKFCGINLHPIKRNLLTEKTMSGNKGFITFEYKIYLGLQETTNQFMKIKEIVSKTDSNNPKSILLAIENLKNLNTQEAKDVIKEYMKKVITWADGKSPGYILSASISFLDII